MDLPAEAAAQPALPRLDLAPSARGAPPTEGLGGGEDPTLDPDNDADRNTLTETGEATTERNPQIDGRPIDPKEDAPDGWGDPYGSCHGVVAFKNIVPEPTERARIAALHDGATPGRDQFSLTVPFNGALAYQCVEFVTRYYRDALGHGDLGGGNAQTFLQGPRGGLELHRFPTPTRPQAGDLMVMEGGPSPVGHVGIVKEMTGGEEGAASGTVTQQNWGKDSPDTPFTVTPSQVEQEVAPTVYKKVDVYEASHGWSGFRRKGGVEPVEERGGHAESLWLGGVPDHGEGNYFVRPGQTVHLSTLQSIYGVSADDLRRYNPCIGDAITAPDDGPVEIRVTDSFVPAEPVIGNATINEGGTSVRSGPGRGFDPAGGCSFLSAGRTVMVCAVVDGGDAGRVEGSESREWYRIAIYTNEPAYVFKGNCSELA